jgi:hypothetical protein
MRELRILGLAAVLSSAFLVTTAWADDAPDAPSHPFFVWNPRIAQLFGTGQKPPPPTEKPKEKERKKSVETAKTEAPAGGKDTNEERLQREYSNLLRRQDVCDRLRTIALEKQDEELERMVFELEQRAQNVYNERTAQLGTSGVAPVRGGKP